jgi:ADP-ribose pyrophosphatase YjhB (NUDIX family)
MELLLLTRANEPGIGKLALPGGFLNYGELAEDAVAREVWEETELRSVSCQFLGMFSVDYAYLGGQVAVLELSFLVDTGSSPLSCRSTAEARLLEFYPIDELIDDPSQLAFPEQVAALRLYRERISDAKESR